MLKYNINKRPGTDGTTIIIDSTGGTDVIEFSLFSKNVNNRYLNYIDNIPSLIKGYKSDKFKTLKNIKLYGKYNFDSTIFIKDEIGNLIYEMETDNTSNEYSEDVNVLINPNTNIHIFVKSASGIDYPVVLLEVT